MAEFEIIDEYTYEVCLLPKEKALGFVDYLNSIGVKSKAKQGYSSKYTVYVTNNLDAIKAKQELIKYANSPFNQTFTRASWKKGNTIKREKQLSSRFYLPLTVDFSTITTIVEVICIALFLLFLVNESFVIKTFALNKAFVFTDEFSYYKLLTPVFVHFSFFHIAFNIVMFEAIGRPIEKGFGKVKFFTILISTALISNVIQYCFMSDFGYFGGLSGVVYGLIGYSGVISLRKDLPYGFNFPKGLLTVSAIFIVLGFFMNGIANLCHIGGLIMGCLWGLVDLKKRKL